MNNELQGLKLEEPTYDDTNRKKSSLDGIVAPTLEDTYIPPQKTQISSLDDIVAPTLEDTYVAPPVQKKVEPEAVVKAALLEDTYTPPTNPQVKKELPPIDRIKAPILDEPAPQQAYVPQFQDPSIEEAKKNAKQNRIKAELNDKPSSFDQKKSLEMYKKLKEEQERELGRKGGKLLIIPMVLGVIAAILTFLYMQLPCKEDVSETIISVCGYAKVFAVIMGVCSLTLLVRAKALKKLATFLFVVGVIASLAGFTLLSVKVDFGVSVAYNVGILALCGFNIFFLNANESIDKFYKYQY